MIPDHLIWWCLAAVLLFWAVGAYNRMVRLRSDALRAFAALGSQLQRFPEHVINAGLAPTPRQAPEEESTGAQSPPVSPVSPVSAVSPVSPVSPNISLTTTPPVEAEPTRAPEPPPTPWAGVLGAATQFAASLAVAKSKPLDGEAMAALGAASAVLLMAWQRAMGEACAASSATSTAAAQLQWEDLQREAGRLAEAFATSIAAYNAAVTQFPAALLAWLFGFREARALAITAP